MTQKTPLPPSIESIFQAPSCRLLGLELEIRLRNTARQLGSGAVQRVHSTLNVDLRAYRQGKLIFHDPVFGKIASGGTLFIRDRDIMQLTGEVPEGEEELLLVARLTRLNNINNNGYFPQEHQLTYTVLENGAQAHLLYDQQPLRSDGRSAPIVLIMPKIWVGGDVNTFLLVCNTSNRQDAVKQTEMMQFSILDESGHIVCAWDQQFFYNEARALNLRDRIAQHIKIPVYPRFFNLVGRGGASSFALFAAVRNERAGHVAIEHSLPPVYYMDGDIERVRSEACVPSLLVADT